MSDVFIIDAVRTPIGAYLGNYKKTESVELGTSVSKNYLIEIKQSILKRLKD